MTLFHTIHQPLARRTVPARAQIKAPAWAGRVAWARLFALGINLVLWGGIILGIRALFRL